MLARKALPAEFEIWNRKWGAPFGRASAWMPRFAKQTSVHYALAPLLGPFSFQSNSVTRTYEFPWVYRALPRSGQRFLEIGGALSGLQFVLAREGCEVHNVDPFLDYGSGNYRSGPERRFRQINRIYKTDVTLHKAALPDISIASQFDAVYSVSTLEHIPSDVLTETLLAARRLLKPGGRMVLTVDLFLNLDPFCHRQTNQYGTNVSPRWIGNVLEMGLIDGQKSELLGFDEFSTENILEHLEDYAMSQNYPQMAQLMAFGQESLRGRRSVPGGAASVLNSPGAVFSKRP